MLISLGFHGNGEGLCGTELEIGLRVTVTGSRLGTKQTRFRLWFVTPKIVWEVEYRIALLPKISRLVCTLYGKR